MSLKVENLKAYYQTLSGDVKALDGATFTIKDGEIMGLAGESGCGKTTLGNSLIYLTPPLRFVEGSVELDDEELPVWDMKKMDTFRFKKISIIPQYAMNAMNPTRKIGRMISELLESRTHLFSIIIISSQEPFSIPAIHLHCFSDKFISLLYFINFFFSANML